MSTKEGEPTLEELQIANQLQSTVYLDKDKVEALELATSLRKFTCDMFKEQNRRPFVIGDHHLKIFNALQRVVDKECNRLIINMPPRYGKTEVVIKAFTAWCYALNPMCRFLHLSYSDRLVYGNSSTIRDIMMLPKYKRLFPNSALESETSSNKQWKTKAGGEFYAVSTKGQVTGFGAGNVDNPEADLNNEPITGIYEIDDALNKMGAHSNVFQGAILIDDPLKPDDAESEIEREKINDRFENTIRSRVNSSDTPIIIIMQRLHEHDLCGYLLEKEPGVWDVLSLPALVVDEDTGEETALWPFKHSVQELHRMQENSPLVFESQYQQDPQPKEGMMYQQGFKTYQPEMLPLLLKTARGLPRKCCYVDTADTGKDSLCAICFIDTPEYCYVTDVLFTNAPMEYTEPKTAEFLNSNGTRYCLIESNNGGRGFARRVKSILRVNMKNFICTVNGFTQTQNKRTRILTNSGAVQNDILFPEGWDKQWRKFYSAITTFRHDNSKSSHDDAPDCLTGVYEMHARKCRTKKIVLLNG